MTTYRNPTPTVDIIIELIDRPHRPIILIERLNPPYGWALPGGFVDYGESVETAAQREAQEETGLQVELIEQFYVYSDPNRDPRQHTLSVVFLATATGEPNAGDDAKHLGVFEPWQIPANLCFDHDRILRDYWRYRHYRLRPQLSDSATSRSSELPKEPASSPPSPPILGGTNAQSPSELGDLGG